MTFWAEELRAVGPELLRGDLEGMRARLQAVSRRACRTTMERVLTVRTALRKERLPCLAYGSLLRLVDQRRRRELQGLIGEALFRLRP